MTVLIENVRHHVEEEEDDLFPKVREALGRKDLGELGDAMEQARRIAPTHPHPRSPDTPPANIAVGAVAGVADRIGDGVKDAAQGAVSTAQDVIGRIVGGRGEPTRNGNPATTAKRAASKASTNGRKAAGSAKKATTSTAKRASGTAKKASTATKRAGTNAKQSTTSTAKRAGSTAKKTAGTARTTARKTAATAKTTAKRSAAARR